MTHSLGRRWLIYRRARVLRPVRSGGVQLADLRPDLTFDGLRGNMATRLAKADRYDAIVVAAVALERLGLSSRISDVLSTSVMVPQVAQGALAVECRVDDEDTRNALAEIEHADSRRAVDAERAFLAELGGDCDLPAGAYATTAHGLHLEGLLASLDGRVILRHRAEGEEPEALGRTVARHLLDAAGGRSPDGVSDRTRATQRGLVGRLAGELVRLVPDVVRCHSTSPLPFGPIPRPSSTASSTRSVNGCKRSPKKLRSSSCSTICIGRPADSLQLLRHVFRSTGSARLFLLGAYRDTEIGHAHPLTEPLGDHVLALTAQRGVSSAPITCAAL